jgi:hypothetical protein
VDDHIAEEVVRRTLPAAIVVEFDRALGRAYGSDDPQYVGPVDVTGYQLAALRRYGNRGFKTMRFEVDLTKRDGEPWLVVRKFEV